MGVHGRHHRLEPAGERDRVRERVVVERQVQKRTARRGRHADAGGAVPAKRADNGRDGIC